ncbi:MAG: Asp23/Gls24 family envelope stress response protein [Thermoleophilia bacterium]|jgi:uncharacterized alkaline shock family protein YloU
MTEYLIATSVLEDIVRGALAGDARVQVHAPSPLTRTRAVEVGVQGEECHVTVQLNALLGENLPVLAQEVRQKIGTSLVQMTGLTVTGVDVVFAGVFPSDN